MSPKNVAVGMSGGIDSTAAALLLLEKGYNVTGYFMDIGAETCPEIGQKDSLQMAQKEAEKVAHILGIKLVKIDLKDSFKRLVVDHFISEYVNGRTPNPCILCNQFLKFGLLFERALADGADFYATGHYVRVMKTKDQQWVLKKGLDRKKDQSYALYRLKPEQLPRLLFPLGDYEKTDISKLVSGYKIDFSDKKESQEICFIPDNNHGLFIEKNCPANVKEGKIVSEKGEYLGSHSGLPYYTVGQRRGLALAMGERYYIKEIRPETNAIVVSGLKGLYARGLRAKYLNWLAFANLKDTIEVTAKIRYNAQPIKAYVSPGQPGSVEVIFSSPLVAVTPGQSVVFYDGDIVLGGGIIEESIS